MGKAQTGGSCARLPDIKQEPISEITNTKRAEGIAQCHAEGMDNLLEDLGLIPSNTEQHKFS
jgi:hypothetical protein